MSTVPTPPRQTGDPRQDMAAFLDWAYKLYAALTLATDSPGAILARIGALPEVTATISDPPTQAEVEAVKAAVNGVIAAARG